MRFTLLFPLTSHVMSIVIHSHIIALGYTNMFPFTIQLLGCRLSSLVTALARGAHRDLLSLSLSLSLTFLTTLARRAYRDLLFLSFFLSLSLALWCVFVCETEKMKVWYVVVLFVLCSVIEVRSDASDHRNKPGDQVPLYANKVGPFHNPR